MTDIDDDYDDYVEFMLRHEPDAGGSSGCSERIAAYEEDCERIRDGCGFDIREPAPADVWRSDPVGSWRSLLAERSGAEPIGFVPNGSRIDNERRLRSLVQLPPRAFGSAPRHDRRVPRHSPKARRHTAAITVPTADDDPSGRGRHPPGRVALQSVRPIDSRQCQKSAPVDQQHDAGRAGQVADECLCADAVTACVLVPPRPIATLSRFPLSRNEITA